MSGTDGSLTLSLSGDDSDDFNIPSGGTVNWVSSPNYEDPTDADKDNRYRVTIQASDGTNEAKLQVTVVVTNDTERRGRTPNCNRNGPSGRDPDGGQVSHMVPLATTMGPGYLWLRSDGTTDTEIEGSQGEFQLHAGPCR